MKSILQEENEELINDFLAQVEISMVGKEIHRVDWEKKISGFLWDLLNDLIDQVRDDEVEKATQVWSVYIEKMIGSIDSRMKAKDL